MVGKNNQAKKIRVLIAAHIGEPVGGISVNYENLLNSSLHNQVTLSFVETSKGNFKFENRGRWSLANYINSVNNVLRFIEAMINKKPNLVHVGTAYNPSFTKHSLMVLIAKLLGARVIVQFHCGYDRFFNISRLGKIWALWIIRLCDGIIIISKEWYELEKVIPGIKIAYIPNAIELEPYVKNKKSENFIQKDPVKILFLGHLGKEKGIFDLIQAAHETRKITITPFTIDIFGENQYQGEKDLIERSIEKLSLKEIVKIFPPVYDQEKISRLASADIFVLPSYHEGMPISILEAMASGLPVIATIVGGIPDEVIDNQTGILFEAGKIDQLVTALCKLINNPNERKRMGLAGQTRAKDLFSIESKVTNLMKFYNGILC